MAHSTRRRRRRRNPEDEEEGDGKRKRKKKGRIDWPTFALSAVAGGFLGGGGAYYATKMLRDRERKQQEAARREAERLARMLTAQEARAAIGPAETEVQTPASIDEILFGEE